MYDLVIIGGGPAGTAAGVYASRKHLKTLFITKDWGGQSTESDDIQNWIGSPSITGKQLAKDFENHLRTYSGEVVTIKENCIAEKVTKLDEGKFQVSVSDGTQVETKAVLVASGSKRRKLNITGAAEFENKGLTYCASCDGPLFTGQDVAVIGGGNAGFETAAQLLAYAKSVTLLHHKPDFKADPVTIEKVLSHENMTGILNADTIAVTGDKFVDGITYKDLESGEEKSIEVKGIFVEIGMLPNTDLVSDVVDIDEYNRIKIDPWTQRSSTDGIWAAGDCTNIKYHQNNIAAGDAVRAVEDIYVQLKTK